MVLVDIRQKLTDKGLYYKLQLPTKWALSTCQGYLYSLNLLCELTSESDGRH
jgi:hypothetical protein